MLKCLFLAAPAVSSVPAFKIINSFTPGLLAFFDAGYFNFVYYPEAGFLFSTGLGAYLDLWGLGTLNIYTIFLLSRPLIDGGGFWVPFSISFGMQF